MKARIIILEKNKGKLDQETKVKIKLSGPTKDKIDFSLKDDDQSESKAKAYALLWILSKEKKNNLKIITSSKGLIKWIGGGINEAEDRSWLNVKNANLWKAVLNDLRIRDRKVVVKTPSKKKQ